MNTVYVVVSTSNGFVAGVYRTLEAAERTKVEYETLYPEHTFRISNEVIL